MELTLTKLPWYAQVGAFVALALGGCGYFYFSYEATAREEIASRQTQLDALRGDITKGLNTAKKLPELARGMGQAVKEFQKAKDEFSDELNKAGKTEEPTVRPAQASIPRIEPASPATTATEPDPNQNTTKPGDRAEQV